MQNAILSKLAHIEQAHNIKLLLACESGSRGWQFPSPDSDYDVRFIYIRPFSFYLSVTNQAYDLNFSVNDDLDISGWDIRKVLQLVRKSNTTPFEWLQSPIIYRQETGFINKLWSLCSYYFCQRSNIHHYLGMAQSALNTVNNENGIKIKKLFYILRPLLAAKWCLEKNSIAPMTMAQLMALLPVTMQVQVNEMITLKAGAAEGQVIQIPAALKSYIEQEFARISKASRGLDRNYFGTEKLDAFFLKTIQQNDN